MGLISAGSFRYESKGVTSALLTKTCTLKKLLSGPSIGHLDQFSYSCQNLKVSMCPA